MYDIGCGGRLIKSWPVYSLVIYPFTKAFGMIQRTERRHHPKSLTRPGPAMLSTVESNRSQGNDRRGGFYAAEWGGSGEH